MVRLLLVLPLLLLSSCFVSRQPLITPALASWPFKDGQIASNFVNCGGAEAAMIVQCKDGARGYVSQNQQVKLKRVEKGYVREEIPARPPSLKDDAALFQDVGDGYYLMQTRPDLPGSELGAMYTLMKLDGRNAYHYVFLCEKSDWPSFRDGSGDPGKADRGKFCEVDNLPQVTKAFEQRVAKGAVPDFRWELVP